MTTENKTEWDDLTPAQQEPYINNAKFLMDDETVGDPAVTLVIAKKMYYQSWCIKLNA